MPKLAVAQLNCVVGDVGANVAKMVDLIAEARGQSADLVCFPECATTGLVYDGMADLAEPVPGPSSAGLCAAAAEASIWVVAGMATRSGDDVYNSALVISPTGDLAAVYHKCYLYMSEADSFARGRRACVQDLGFATAGICICYDYIFPEYMRDLVTRGARLLIHPTAWIDSDTCREWGYPAGDALRAQAVTRALENGVYFISANHCGTYDSGGFLQGVGRSAIIAPWGEVLAELPDEEGVVSAEVNFDLIPKWAETAAPYLSDHLDLPRPE